jgi:hypothetical protein
MEHPLWMLSAKRGNFDARDFIPFYAQTQQGNVFGHHSVNKRLPAKDSQKPGS